VTLVIPFSKKGTTANIFSLAEDGRTIASVAEGSVAVVAGLRAGDVVMSVDGESVDYDFGVDGAPKQAKSVQKLWDAHAHGEYKLRTLTVARPKV